MEACQRHKWSDKVSNKPVRTDLKSTMLAEQEGHHFNLIKTDNSVKVLVSDKNKFLDYLLRRWGSRYHVGAMRNVCTR
mgnify:CR=1 FL=1